MSGTTRSTDEGHGRLGSKLSGLAVALGCVLFLGGFLWGAVAYAPYTVPTDSMSPTITSGDRILAERVDGSEIKRGDVVVFRQETWGNAPMVKRVVAVGGDTVACCTDGKLTVNGKQIDEGYLPAGQQAELTGIPEITVPKGRLFLLGDERSGSLDSTAHLTEAGNGTVPRGHVDARVDAVVWPMDGMLARPTGFEKLGALSSPGPLRLITAALVVGMVLVLGGAAYGPVAKRLGGRGGRTTRSEPAGVA
ncbi:MULTISPECIES: signal peptidase I [Streptomyces]|uniref:Signal peptidase I n=1 Tax=Streptomyces caniscabiei TaxID=2746961 RepID=A0ABU4MPW9_9ACTN|nr:MULTISPECIES: signal peptidase I [Streptomyces]MBE4735663.1 signal peptidase I [Streptomyces caniscabiei]MBE4758276.1 signal peptidase I [Streptomyces caniscabiei]MBE4774137.1 signal peptidase I [Streptomyces caniscabiei]MBE4788368.1 signal peptidase I [Streptomyces caniscabiei]MBE4796081.1 signal peptidase I [Streptomyces caniscabiei]